MKSYRLAIIFALVTFVNTAGLASSAMADEGRSDRRVAGEVVLHDAIDGEPSMVGHMFFPNPMDMMGQGMESMFGPMMDRMLEAMQKILDTILALSDDIGKMADRIGDFGDRILTMADKIGTMADRVVLTMDTMSSRMAGSGGGGTMQTSSVLLLAPVNNTEVSRGTPPRLSISDSPERFLLYASNLQTFAPGQTVSFLVTEETPLDDAWDQAVRIAEDDHLYVAVKSIDDENRVSTLSNGVQIWLVD